MDGGAWKATVHEVAKSRTRLSDFIFTFLLCWDLGVQLGMRQTNPCPLESIFYCRRQTRTQHEDELITDCYKYSDAVSNS